VPACCPDGPKSIGITGSCVLKPENTHALGVVAGLSVARRLGFVVGIQLPKWGGGGRKKYTRQLKAGERGLLLLLHHMSGAQYGSSRYWDERYTKEPEAFDWYQGYAGIKDILAQYLKKSDNIMNAGAGNSLLTEDMYDDGYTTIANVDISSVVIEQMTEKHRDRPTLTWQQMNVCALEFPDGSFDAIIDKGTADALLCGEGSTRNAAEMCTEASRVLTAEGVYIIISYGLPDNRLSYFENEDYGWTVTVHTIEKTVGTATPGDPESFHYIYCCKKGSEPQPAREVYAGARAAGRA
jgi:ubiquinone/menaquinone biosynthesis C-methylase UbiE